MPGFDVVCALLVVAGVLKLRAPNAMRRSLRLAGVSLPPSAVRALGLAELAVGAAGANWPGPLTGGLVATSYAVFAAFVLRLGRLAGSADCGCFGEAGASVGPIHVALNVAACGLAIAAALDPPPGLNWIAGRTPLIAVPLALGTVAAAFAAYLAFTALPVAWGAYGVSRGAYGANK